MKLEDQQGLSLSTLILTHCSELIRARQPKSSASSKLALPAKRGACGSRLLRIGRNSIQRARILSERKSTQLSLISLRQTKLPGELYLPRTQRKQQRGRSTEIRSWIRPARI